MDPGDLTDEEIMARVTVERGLFGVLVDRYEAKLRRYVKRIMPGVGEEVDDLLQDIFIKVFVHARGFDTGLSFNSWVYRIAHNEAVSWLRKKKARVETVELGEDECQTFLTSIEASNDVRDARLTADAVARALGTLEERYRSVLVLKFLEGKTYEEIGDILAVPQGTVATLIHRAKKAFTNKYAEHHG